ncbi:MAG: PEP-CTERM sorting domain-containing protein [Pseudomonadota bacterium]
MRTRNKIAAMALGAAGSFFAFAASAAPMVPQVDFRSPGFAAADGKSSFSTVVDGISFTIEAGSDNGAAIFWWDATDGLGVRGGEEDEIDVGEFIRIVFDTTIGLSEVFFSDLFAGETGYDEVGAYRIDGGLGIEFSAAGLLANNAANGEYVLLLDKIVPVNTLTFYVPYGAGRNDFSLLGFTDPPLPITTQDQDGIDIPEPATIGLLGLGLLGLGLQGARSRRRQP